MTLAATGRRALRSPMLWIGVVLVILGVAATVVVGMELYRSTEIQAPYNRR